MTGEPLTFAQIEEIASEDPDDRQIRLAHGFPLDAPWNSVCKNCELTYEEIIGGKIRLCRSDAV